MKKTIFVFGLVSALTLHTFAGPGQIGSANDSVNDTRNEEFGLDSIKSFSCLKEEIRKAIIDIQRIPKSEIDEGTKRYLFSQESMIALSEILTCSSSWWQTISADEARFAIADLNQNMTLQIKKLVADTEIIQSELKAESTDQELRKSLELLLVHTTKQIDTLRLKTDRLVKKIKKKIVQ